MRAFVLSGGGNRGPLQVGALRALLENDIYPEMLVGCSVGALNTSFLARDLSVHQIDRLLDVWRSTTMDDIYPGNSLGVVWRLLTSQDSLYDNCNFYDYLQRHGATPAATFGDLPAQIPFYVTATHLDSERMHVFGDNPHDRVLDALMASTALPPFHPPWLVNNERYVDGGTVTPLPLRVAVERGASEIYALHIWEKPQPPNKTLPGVAGVMNRSISTMLKLHTEHDLLLTDVAKQVSLHEIRLEMDDLPALNDWSQAQRLHDAGYGLAQDYLSKNHLSKTSDEQTAWDFQTAALGRLKQMFSQEWARWADGEEPIPEPVRISNE